ncbi:PBSX family phage terminase large subunit [Veillonella magna]|uniref:PBSX family phage terminase large subunit n=1 Tax=Veillonella magna TaxID=464322 RepID=UPI0026655734|nr:PBSX family phage terminase large subunit [Veillonella magna]
MKKNNGASFQFKPFSRKQKKILTWWLNESPYCDYDMIIADGSIRSGKTVSMVDSFIMWAQTCFRGEAFIIAGRSVGSLKRNILRPLFQILNAKGISYEYNRSENIIRVGSNTFYCFGASNEASQDVLQGLTAAGALADEAALFPQSFINQMIGRCSVEGSKIWMNCNPDSPYHHIKTEFIDKAEEKKILHLHFTLDDNLSLSERVKERYKRMYSGLWYKRFILGLWVMAEGIIYDMFSERNVYSDRLGLRGRSRRYIAIDYGTSNPMVFLDILDDGDRIWVDREYYYSGREKGIQKTDTEYLEDFKAFVGDEYPDMVLIDPSAASFKTLLRREGFRVKEADNEVNDGIRIVGMMLQTGKLLIHDSCEMMKKEFASYVWDEKAAIERGVEQPVKQNDHTMDALRYFIKTMIKKWRLPS